ncbi:MAG: transposase [Bryobacteraceae bacterium]|nr:transposase [Bryobacteraceae bacterium]
MIALHVRVDHIHGLVQAEGSAPGRVVGDWKSYATRALKQTWPDRRRFWTMGACFRSIPGAGLGSIAQYILDEQGDRLEVFDESAGEPIA